MAIHQQLLTQCTKLGIKGKSSGLASLEDNEAALLAKSLGKQLGPPVIVLATSGPTPRAFTEVKVGIPLSIVQPLISACKIASADQLPYYITQLLNQEIRGRHSRRMLKAEVLVEEWVQKNINLNERPTVADIAEYATRCEKYLRGFGYAPHNAENQTSKVFIRMGLRRREPR